MLCESNWIKFSWDGKPLRDSTENFRVDVLSRAQHLIPFQQACDEVAHEIAGHYDNLFITLSGGCDSEHVANVFLRNGIPFTPLIITYEKVIGNDQRYEQWFARHWCRSNNVTPLEIDVSDYVGSAIDHKRFSQLRARLLYGTTTIGALIDVAKQHSAHLVTGMQLEYYPDHEQMTYLKSQLDNYNGFVMQESDFYIESFAPNTHPWAFYYWNPRIMSSFVQAWDTKLTMQENKIAIYGVTPRPKLKYPADMYSDPVKTLRYHFTKKWGSRDCALLGTQQELLDKLVELQ